MRKSLWNTRAGGYPIKSFPGSIALVVEHVNMQCCIKEYAADCFDVALKLFYGDFMSSR